MADSGSGFSFGAPPPKNNGDSLESRLDFAPAPPDSDGEDVEAVEVTGEPVSRAEAQRTGCAGFEPENQRRDAGKTSVRAKKQSGRFQAANAPPFPDDLPPELAQKIAEAKERLANNEIEQALTLAQEAVWEKPTLIPAKVVIARAFLARKEHNKALALLKAITEADKTSESLYYEGVCHNNLEQTKEALEAFKRCLARAQNNPEMRKRATGMISRLQGEYVACSKCGRKVIPDAIIDVGNASVCSACAKKMASGEEEEGEDSGDDADAPGKKRRRRRLRPPLTKGEIFVRLFFVVFMAVIASVFLYLLAPETFRTFRNALPPALQIIIPDPPPTTSIGPPTSEVDAGGKPILPSFLIVSPPLPNPVAGVKMVYALKTGGITGDDAISYAVEFHPEPEGKAALDAESGEFVWTPSANDAGKQFSIVFRAETDKFISSPHSNRATVLPPPRSARVGEVEAPLAGAIAHMFAEDMDGDGVAELVVFAGEYWDTKILIYRRGADAGYEKKWEGAFAGRAAGVGVLHAGPEKWLAVADYWNSRIRYFALRNDLLEEMAITVDLPGRPLLAAFDAATANMAVLCRNERELVAAAFNQSDLLRTRLIRTWPVPDEYLWRHLFLVANPEAAGDDVDHDRLLLVRGGAEKKAVFQLDRLKQAQWSERGGAAPVLMNAAVDRERQRLLLLYAGGQGSGAAML